MNIRLILPLFAAAFLAACTHEQSYSDKPLPPTPMNQPIGVVTKDHVPSKYIVIGQVSGYTLKMLKQEARKLGADAIIKPTSVDPVSKWATTDAIKYQK
jgi:hypothetical protein